MQFTADGFDTKLNALIDSKEVLTGLAVMLVGFVGSHFWGRLVTGRQKITWRVLYDEPVNLGNKDAPVADGTGSWVITYRGIGADPENYEVNYGSLVVVELRNTGRVAVREEDYGKGKLTVKTEARGLVNVKVRDNADYRKQLFAEAKDLPAPNTADSFTLPVPELNPGGKFELLFLLDTKTPPKPGEQPPAVELHATLLGGDGFKVHTPRPWRRRGMLATAVALALTLGVGGGVWLANRALTPAAQCAAGSLDVYGSTAFAPIVDQVASEYEQACPYAEITITANGSGEGLQDLAKPTSSTPMIAMYDGTPDGTSPLAPFEGKPYVSQPVGVVIFAVVGNNHTPAGTLFKAEPGGGLTVDQIAGLYNHPTAAGLSFTPIPVGRSTSTGTVSGTRQAFAAQILGGDDAAENAGTTTCPTQGQICLEPTTMDLLGYVNTTPNAIGYAEADALPYFPDVSAIPIDGLSPTRENALSHNYPFLAVEHLFTVGKPTGLTADFINFLTSKAVTAQLQNSSYIACSDLTGSDLGSSCDS